MGEVIGYHGSAEDRFEAWNTMLFLNKSIAWSKSSNPEVFRTSIQKETQLFVDELTDYVGTPTYEVRVA